jgi:hypothetical protein
MAATACSRRRRRRREEGRRLGFGGDEARSERGTGTDKPVRRVGCGGFGHVTKQAVQVDTGASLLL